MPKTRTAVITAHPAENADFGGITIDLDLAGQRSQSEQITFSTLDELGTNIRGLADRFGKGCAIFVRLPKTDRKPPGFDAFCDKHRYYNLQ